MNGFESCSVTPTVNTKESFRRSLHVIFRIEALRLGKPRRLMWVRCKAQMGGRRKRDEFFVVNHKEKDCLYLLNCNIVGRISLNVRI